MNKPILAAILAMILATLACQQAITPVATVSATPTFAPILADDTATQKPTVSPTQARTESTATILRPVVNLRDEPGGVVIGTLAAGDVVTVLECKDNWCKVSLLEQTGYIYRGCLSGNDDLGCEAR